MATKLLSVGNNGNHGNQVGLDYLYHDNQVV
jgi:hypothetical protein